MDKKSERKRAKEKLLKRIGIIEDTIDGYFYVSGTEDDCIFDFSKLANRDIATKIFDLGYEIGKIKGIAEKEKEIAKALGLGLPKK